MATSSKKRKSFIRQHSVLFIALASALLSSIIFLALVQFLATRSKSNVAIPVLHSKLAYVDGNDATDQVANFYKQYIDARTTPVFRTKLIAAYGDKNLSFYNEYYLHGFDPITCSSVMPSKVTAMLVSTGPVAKVNATEEFSDGTRLTIKTAVVLYDKLAIDSITCPGAKGNLSPDSPL